jgi:hypothetical protein
MSDQDSLIKRLEAERKVEVRKEAGKYLWSKEADESLEK